MSLKLMYITNSPDVALIAEKYGVDRIWIDLETLGKKERQSGMNTVQSRHTVEDIKKIAPLLTKSELLVRINPWHDGSVREVEEVIDAGAEMIMLPMWKNADEVKQFLAAVNGRCKTTLLLETKEAEACLDEVLDIAGFDEIHIGLNDLHLSYGLEFMFELLSNGTVERICRKLQSKGIPYGFGGIAKLGSGDLPAEKIIMEHYRLGSTRAILSRSFCDTDILENLNEIENVFAENLSKLRDYEQYIAEKAAPEDYKQNVVDIKTSVQAILAKKGNRKMDLSTEKLLELSRDYGDAFYLLDSKQFTKNYKDLSKAFSDIYPHFNIAYSYKTNYIPKLCRIVNEHGGYAEVVSDMEMEIAVRVGVKPEKIIWNGPVKNNAKVEELLVSGGTVNVDSADELVSIQKITEKHPEKFFHIGIRCNFDVGDGVVSRFGFDTKSAEFDEAVRWLKDKENVELTALQCHFAKRNVEYWPARAEGMIKTVKEVEQKIGYVPKRIDLGGGIFGNMAESLKKQFSSPIPEYQEYAKAAATVIRNAFPNAEPELLIEPGSALAGDSMKFVGRVETIKKVRGKTFATMLGSQKNISMSGVNPPMKRYAVSQGTTYQNVDIVGYTCIESDVMYRGYQGALTIGDYMVFSNCGSYSIVMKPPFILPNFAVVDICGDKTELIKRAENFDDLFHTYVF